MQKEHRDFPCGARACGRSGGGGGRANLEGTSALFPPLHSAPSSPKAWYSLLRWGRNVPCVSYGLCPVLHWPLYIYTSFFSFGILLSVSHPCSHMPTSHLGPAPHHESSRVQRTPWRRKVALQKGETPSPLSLSHHPAMQQPPRSWTLQFGSDGSLGP